MKKLFVCLLVFVMMFSLAACGEQSEPVRKEGVEYDENGYEVYKLTLTVTEKYVGTDQSYDCLARSCFLINLQNEEHIYFGEFYSSTFCRWQIGDEIECEIRYRESDDGVDYAYFYVDGKMVSNQCYYFGKQ